MPDSMSRSRTVAILGAGPVGLAAAAHVLERGLEPIVLEAGPQAAYTVRQWGHVRMFSPWEYNIDKAAERLLKATGWNAPPPGDYPTGEELVERYLEPLATRTPLKGRIRTSSRVTAVARAGFDKMKSDGRASAPFTVRWQNGRLEQLEADAVIDATGTWLSPNPAGADGLPALGAAFARLVGGGRMRVEAGFKVSHIIDDGARLRVATGAAACCRAVTVDELVVATGFRPQLDFLRELRIALDPAVESPPALAPLIDPNIHSCGTVRPHGAAELRQPEPGFYFAGIKSYGRAPTFLMLTGYEQVRSIVAEIAGDHEAAAKVEVVLPETGVCSGPAAAEPAAGRQSTGDAAKGCCG